MKHNAKTPFIPGGGEQRYIEKGIHAGKKANEREIEQGSLENVIREKRAKVQNDNPDMPPEQAKRIADRRIERSMRPYAPPKMPVSNKPPEQGLVNLKAESEKERKRTKKNMQKRRRAA